MCLLFLTDSTPLEAEEDYLLLAWSDSKWAHLVHCEEIFDSELELLTPYGKPYLGYTARLRFLLLNNGSRCSATVHAARRWFTCSAPAHNCLATHHGGRTMSLTARLCSHLLGQTQDGVAQRIQGARGLAVGGTTPDTHDRPHGLRP